MARGAVNDWLGWELDLPLHTQPLDLSFSLPIPHKNLQFPTCTFNSFSFCITASCSQALTWLCTQLTHCYGCCQITTPMELKPPKSTALSWQVTLPASEPSSTQVDPHPPQRWMCFPFCGSSGQSVGFISSWLQDPETENTGSNYLLAKKAAIAATWHRSPLLLDFTATKHQARAALRSAALQAAVAVNSLGHGCCAVWQGLALAAAVEQEPEPQDTRAADP